MSKKGKNKAKHGDPKPLWLNLFKYTLLKIATVGVRQYDSN